MKSGTRGYENGRARTKGHLKGLFPEMNCQSNGREVTNSQLWDDALARAWGLGKRVWNAHVEPEQDVHELGEDVYGEGRRLGQMRTGTGGRTCIASDFWRGHPIDHCCERRRGWWW